jgi:hypothetical protein
MGTLSACFRFTDLGFLRTMTLLQGVESDNEDGTKGGEEDSDQSDFSAASSHVASGANSPAASPTPARSARKKKSTDEDVSVYVCVCVYVPMYMYMYIYICVYLCPCLCGLVFGT